MSRFILVPMMLAATLAVTVAGCNRFPDLSIQVVANLAPDRNRLRSDRRSGHGARVWSHRPSGSLGVRWSYVITPLVESYIVSNALEFQGQQGNMQITDFEITIVLPDGSLPDLGEGVPNPYKVQTSAVIPANQSPGSVSARATFAVAIPPTLLPRSAFHSGNNRIRFVRHRDPGQRHHVGRFQSDLSSVSLADRLLRGMFGRRM